LNLRPLDPQSSALPDCATLRRPVGEAGLLAACGAGANAKMLKTVKHRRVFSAGLIAALFAATLGLTPAAAQDANLHWVQTPTSADAEAAYPATAGGVAGKVVVSCGLTEVGEPTGCVVVSEDPPGLGFGPAALNLARKLRAATPVATAMIKPAGVFSIPIAFEAPPALRPLQYHSDKAFARLGPPGRYFPDRSQRAGIGGQAVIDCVVSADGRLNACIVVSESPPGWDFKEAALRMARDGWITVEPMPTKSGERDIARVVVDFPRPPRDFRIP
jgi:TonB family protein